MANPDPARSTGKRPLISARVFARIGPAMDAKAPSSTTASRSLAWPARCWRSVLATASTSPLPAIGCRGRRRGARAYLRGLA